MLEKGYTYIYNYLYILKYLYILIYLYKLGYTYFLEKECLVILISYLKRVGSSTQTFSLSFPAKSMSNITESLWKAMHTWGAWGKASFCRSSADEEPGETLFRASQGDPRNYLSAAALRIAL